VLTPGHKVPYTDAQSHFYGSFFRAGGGGNGTFIATTDPSTTEPRAVVYDTQNAWQIGQMVIRAPWSDVSSTAPGLTYIWRYRILP